jgi:thiamine-monophosphate kinase
MSLEDIGWRSFHAAVSDIGAMGAAAWGALSAIECPKSLSDRELYAIVSGQAEAAKSLQCPVVGGNLSKASKISISTTALGRCKHAILRSSAKPGNEIWLIGDVGLAAAGFAVLSRRSRRLHGESIDVCVSAFRRPHALLADGKSLSGRATAAIDISDGLVGDARHVAECSHVALLLDLDKLSGALHESLVVTSKMLGRSAMELALYGGEDYALLATGPSRLRPFSAKVIGSVEKGRGVWLVSSGKKRRALRQSFDHFGGRGDE